MGEQKNNGVECEPRQNLPAGAVSAEQRRDQRVLCAGAFLHRDLRQQSAGPEHAVCFGDGHRHAPVRCRHRPHHWCPHGPHQRQVGKFRPFMVIGNLIMAASILVLYCLTPLIPASAMGLRYAAFVALYAVWVIGYTFQTSCTRSGQTVLTNDPKQRPLFTIFNTVGSLLGMGAMQFFAPILAKNYEAATLPPGSSARWLRWASSSPSCSPCWLSSASGRRTSQVLRHRRRGQREGQAARVRPDHQEQ